MDKKTILYNLQRESPKDKQAYAYYIRLIAYSDDLTEVEKQETKEEVYTYFGY